MKTDYSGCNGPHYDESVVLSNDIVGPRIGSGEVILVLHPSPLWGMIPTSSNLKGVKEWKSNLTGLAQLSQRILRS